MAGRPKKDALAPKAPKFFDNYRVPVGRGRCVYMRVPVGGLSFQEIELLAGFVKLFEAEEEDDEEEDEQGDLLMDLMVER